jgi:hypothetical protein
MNKLQQVFAENNCDIITYANAVSLSRKTGLKIYLFDMGKYAILSAMDYIDLTAYNGTDLIKITDCYHSNSGFVDEIIIGIRHIVAYFQV